MPSAKQPKIVTGQSLDVQPGISNIGENRAELAALRNANIDGQDTFPQSVSTKRLAADDINVSGIVKSGSILVGTGGVAITSDDAGGTPDTGLYLGSSALYLLKAGSPTVTLDGATGDATITGAITATSGTFTGTITASTIETMTSVNFGTDVTIGGNIIINAGAYDGKVRFDGESGSSWIDYYSLYDQLALVKASSGLVGMAQGADYETYGYENPLEYPSVWISGGSIVINTSGIYGSNPTTRDVEITLNTNSGNSFVVKRGSTPVITVVGNSSTVTFAGSVVLGDNSSVSSSSGLLTVSASSGNLYLSGRDTFLSCTSGYHGALRHGSTEVLYWANNTIDVTCTTGLRVQSAAYIHSGSGSPAAGLGSTGDAYLSTGGSFWVKQATGWRRIDNWVT